jgi:hypothetical protein
MFSLISSLSVSPSQWASRRDEPTFSCCFNFRVMNALILTFPVWVGSSWNTKYDSSLLNMIAPFNFYASFIAVCQRLAIFCSLTPACSCEQSKASMSGYTMQVT